MTTIDQILQKMEKGKIYHFGDYSGITEDQSLRSEIGRASRMGLILTVARGCYQITPKGLESVKWYNIERKRLLSREHVNDTPPIAWPV